MESGRRQTENPQARAPGGLLWRVAFTSPASSSPFTSLCALWSPDAARSHLRPRRAWTQWPSSAPVTTVSSLAEGGDSKTVQARARTSHTLQVLEGTVTLTLADGSAIWGTYRGTANLPSSGQHRATFEGAVTGGGPLCRRQRQPQRHRHGRVCGRWRVLGGAARSGLDERWRVVRRACGTKGNLDVDLHDDRTAAHDARRQRQRQGNGQHKGHCHRHRPPSTRSGHPTLRDHRRITCRASTSAELPWHGRPSSR